MQADPMIIQGFTVWLTGLSGAGKSTTAELLATRLKQQSRSVEVLDGDAVRNLSKDLGFSKEDRDENVRRISMTAERLSSGGTAVIVAAISPYRTARAEARARIERFIEVHVHCPLEVLVKRDPKGLYRRAMAGDLAHFTGISDPYEPPLDSEVSIDSSSETPEESVEKVWAALVVRGLVAPE